MEVSPSVKEKILVAFDVTKTIFHWGFIPTVIYLGFRKGPEAGMPPFGIMNLLWQ